MAAVRLAELAERRQYVTTQELIVKLPDGSEWGFGMPLEGLRGVEWLEITLTRRFGKVVSASLKLVDSDGSWGTIGGKRRVQAEWEQNRETNRVAELEQELAEVRDELLMLQAERDLMLLEQGDEA